MNKVVGAYLGGVNGMSCNQYDQDTAHVIIKELIKNKTIFKWIWSWDSDYVGSGGSGAKRATLQVKNKIGNKKSLWKAL